MIIVGIDEVGRGSWAGPVVAGAVILPSVFHLPGLRDSKLIGASERRQLNRLIRQQAVAAGIGWVSSAEVDAHGLSWAIRHSGLRALAVLGTSYDHVILDGKHNYLLNEAFSSEVIVAADSSIPAVSAAAILAKVARDTYMSRLAKRYPGYGFKRHVGYGTAFHRQALERSGVTDIHRQSYKPVQRLVVA